MMLPDLADELERIRRNEELRAPPTKLQQSTSDEKEDNDDDSIVLVRRTKDIKISSSGSEW